jgi:hypothetical protein
VHRPTGNRRACSLTPGLTLSGVGERAPNAR